MATVLLVIIYILAIGLGVPDSALGAAWPAIYSNFEINISLVNCISTIVACGTIISSMFSARVINHLGVAKVTAISTIMTVAALFGYSISPNLIVICLFAIPLGLGAGAIDTAINNYMALNYKEMYMNFMHCFYGVGVMISPYLMSYALQQKSWRMGYMLIAAVQGIIAIVSVFAIPLWGKVSENKGEEDEKVAPRTLKINEMISNHGIRFACLFFFASTSIEAICTVWSSSFMVTTKSFSASEAASYLVLYYLGVTVGRLISGIITNKVSSWTIIKMGIIFIFCGVIILFIGSLPIWVMLGLFLIGMGVAPIFPTLLFLTPQNFGIDISQSVIGIEMAAAYCGSLLAPIIVGLLTNIFSMRSYPFILVLFIIIVICSDMGLVLYLKKQRQK